MTLGTEQLAPAERRAMVEAFAWALKREAYVFLQRPGVGPPLVTVWSEPVRRGLFRRRPAGEKFAVGCPLCRVWSDVPASALGTELPCPNCSRRLKLNPFTIDGDWRPIAAAWRGSGG